MPISSVPILTFCLSPDGAISPTVPIFPVWGYVLLLLKDKPGQTKQLSQQLPENMTTFYSYFYEYWNLAHGG